MKDFLRRCVASLMIVSLSGCSLIPAVAGTGTDEERRQSVVEQVIADHWEEIEPYVGMDSEDRSSSAERITPHEVIELTLQEENGREYIDFCYSIATGADVSEVLERAESLLTEKQYAQLEGMIEEQDRMIYESFSRDIFSVTEANRADFIKDLRKLVVSSTVLLTASIVYSVMPHMFFWGKVSAMAAVSVSAGAVAGTIMCVYGWYENDPDYEDAFKEWLKMITEDPYESYLLVTSVISMGHSMGLNPLCCSIIVGVFALYNALDIIRDMLEAYGEEVEQ